MNFPFPAAVPAPKALMFALFGGLLCLSSLRGEILKDSRDRPVRYGGNLSAAPVNLPVLKFRRVQTRAVWCSVVYNLDFPRCTDAKKFKRAFADVLAQLKRHNCNVLIFQLRAGCDAAYLSRINPFSRWITGREGQTLGPFDPLTYMVQECRRSGIEFYAWLNPYRVAGATSQSKEAYLAGLSPMNIARRRPDLVLASPTRSGRLSLQLDPGRPEVIRHILSTVHEIISRAPVSGIVFDDYFYPYDPLLPGTDRASFLRFNPRRLSLEDWRRENVNLLLRECSRLCRSRCVRFGVSPFGIWANSKTFRGGSLTRGMESRQDIFADTLHWLHQNYLDFVIPQVYWPFDHPKAPYAAVTDWWVLAARRYPRTALYIGHSPGLWGPAELANQLRYNSVHPEIRGEAVFALRHLKGGKYTSVLKKCWPVPVPSR